MWEFAVLPELQKIYKDSLINLYLYGGQVYGIRNKLSDFDYIAVVNDAAIRNKTTDEHVVFEAGGEKHDVNVYSDGFFKRQIIAHEISALECIFLPEPMVIKKAADYTFELDLGKLRESIAAKSSHSFVKARKKLRFGEIYIGKKSMWHSFRIIHFGIQIAKYGKIVDYAAANYLYNDIVLNERNDEDYYKEIYLHLHNELMTEFRKLAPKKEAKIK